MEFNVGDKVVYPSQGVSVVESITDEELAGCTMNCYTLRLLSTDSKVVVPVTNSERVGLRPLSEVSAVKRALLFFRDGLNPGNVFIFQHFQNLGIVDQRPIGKYGFPCKV